VDGVEMRDFDSPSWYNVEEMDVIWNYIKSLSVQFAGKIQPEEIGVIAPYHKQVLKMKQRRDTRAQSELLFFGQHNRRATDVVGPTPGTSSLRGGPASTACKGTTSANGIKIGTVENFQGQENEVIFVSTVRSRLFEEVVKDIRMTLGFVGSRQRLNVALSRAQKLLVVVGNAKLLAQDKSWNKLLRLAACFKCLKNVSVDELLPLEKAKTSEQFEESIAGMTGEEFISTAELPWRQADQT